MHVQLLGLLLFACQIVENRSSIVQVPVEDKNVVTSGPVEDPNGYITFSEDHAAYKIYREVTTWNEARERCIADGARLAITDTSEKIRRINSLKTDWDSQWIHVGFYHSNDTNEWLRVDNGLPATALPWASFNPDAMATTGCAGLPLSEYGLVNYSCDDWSEYFVCEIPIEED